MIDIELIAHGNLAPTSGVALTEQTDDVLAAAAIDRGGRLNIAWGEPRSAVGGAPAARVLWPRAVVRRRPCKAGRRRFDGCRDPADATLRIAWVNELGTWQGPVPVGPPILEPHSGVALAHQTAEVFVATAVGRNGQLHVAWVDGNATWQGPVPVGAAVLEPSSRLALAKQGDKILVCAALGRDGTLHIAWVNETGNWQGPVPVGGPVLEPHSGIALSYQTGDTLTATAISRDGTLHIAWVDGTGNWNGPIPIGGAVLEPWSGVAAEKQGADILVVAAIGSNGELRVAFVNDGGQWQGPVPVGARRPGTFGRHRACGSRRSAHGRRDWRQRRPSCRLGRRHRRLAGPVPIHGATERICQLTGNYDREDLPHRNDSTQAGVGGTDLGFPVDFASTIFLFGDQFGDPRARISTPSGSPPRARLTQTGSRWTMSASPARAVTSSRSVSAGSTTSSRSRRRPVASRTTAGSGRSLPRPWMRRLKIAKSAGEHG